jgi:putative transposase
MANYAKTGALEMKKSKFTESQIFNILKQVEGGVKVADLCREHGLSSATLYKWRAKYSGMDASMVKRLRELEEENSRLKRMYANAQMDNEVVKEALEKKF